MTNRKTRSFESILYIFIIYFGIVSISYSYQARIDIDGKLGNKRHIIRTGMLFPIYYNDSSMLFTPLFFMGDNKNSLEGNFGIGFRKKIYQLIVGSYGFYDIRKLPSTSTKIHQINFGLEFLATNYEFRFNVYIPRKKSVFVGETKNLIRNFDSKTNITTENLVSSKIYDFILKGYDLELGYSIPKLRQLNIFGSFYHFFRDSIKMNGFRARARHELFYWLALTAEYSYDNIRNSNFYGGIRLSYLFDRKTISYKDNDRFSRKMTQLPVRDIDIISETESVTTTELRVRETGYIVKHLNDDSINYLKNQGITVDENNSNALLTKNTVNKIKAIVNKGIRIDNFVDSKIDGTNKSYLVSSGGILNLTSSSVASLESFLGNNNIDLKTIFLPNSTPFTAILVAQRAGTITLANSPRLYSGVNINDFILIKIGDPAPGGLLGFIDNFDRLVTLNQQQQHAVYNALLNLPKNVVVQHPYNPVDQINRPNQFDGDRTRTLAALEMQNSVIPQPLIEQLKALGIGLSSTKTYIVVQTKPWGIGTQILLRPQPLTGANASNGAGTQSAETVRAFRYDHIGTNSVTPLSQGNISVTVHDGVFSGNSLPTTLSSANSSAEFSLVVHNPDTANATAHITYHMLLNQADARLFSNNITNVMNPASRMHDFVNRFSNPASGVFLQSQYNTVRNFVFAE